MTPAVSCACRVAVGYGDTGHYEKDGRFVGITRIVYCASHAAAPDFERALREIADYKRLTEAQAITQAVAEGRQFPGMTDPVEDLQRIAAAALDKARHA